MPRRRATPLPEPLRYLQPFARALEGLPPEELNEDVDAAPLEAALRRRVDGLDRADAEARLVEDRDRLRRWLDGRPDHPAHWILGFLSMRTLASALAPPTGPAAPGQPGAAPDGRPIDPAPPDGWRVKPLSPAILQLRRGPLRGTIMAIDEATLHQMQHEREQAWTVAAGVEATRERHAAQYGRVEGRKDVWRRIAPDPSTRIDYLLRVPGGFVLATVESKAPELDESPFEDLLRTVRLSAPASSRSGAGGPGATGPATPGVIGFETSPTT